MDTKFNAILTVTIADDIRILPFWLNYHKDLFHSGNVILGIGQNDEEGIIKRTIMRLCPNWILSTNQRRFSEESDESVTSFPISMSEFIPAGVSISDVFKNTPIKRSAWVDMKTSPNNIVDFFSNVYERSSSIQDSSTVFPELEIVFLLPNNMEMEPEPEPEPEPSIHISKIVKRIQAELKTRDYVYYLDAYIHSDVHWGDDRVILSEDTNLLENTNFNADGHAIFPMKSYHSFLRRMVETKIEEITSRQIDIEKYHLHISDDEHTQIINSMPWKKTEYSEIREFAEYMETTVSTILKRRVKIFNDDIWVRICRPSSITNTDYNPCHRDIYLDFYRNIANIYVPIVGSNEHSSLAMQSGSHLWNERDIVVTRGGAYFGSSGKKYSVDAVLRSRLPLHMTRPNPKEDEFILFSPYLIHGCSSNDNIDMTRMSVEIRFIEDTEQGKKQEVEFRQFLEKRVWR